MFLLLHTDFIYLCKKIEKPLIHVPRVFLTKSTMYTCAYTLMVSLLLVLVGCSGTAEKTTPSPHADHGIFDLRGHPLSGDETVALDGEWEFYWDQLLTPDNFCPGHLQPELTEYFSLPGSWARHKRNGHRLGGIGQATFRLRLLPDRTSGNIHLRLFDIHEAYKLWANGKLIAQSGVPGRSAATERPARSLVIANLLLQGRPIDLVLQVSNHHFRTGGPTESLLVALPGTLETMRTQNWGLSLFLIGCMLIMGIYHLVLYFFQKRDRVSLYFGLYCMLVVGYSCSSNSSHWVASILLPWWNPVGMEVFSLTCFVIWPSLFFRFLKKLYPEEIHTILGYFLDARIVLFFCLLAFASSVSIYWFIAFCLLQSMSYTTYYIPRLFLCVRRGRDGAKFLFAGLIIQFFAGINDVLTHLGFIQSVYLAEPAVCLFVLFQSLALAKRFSSSFDAVGRLSVELEQKNTSLLAEIAERNRLEQEVVNISEEERLRISHELHDGLCQQLTGARLRTSTLAHKHKGLADEQALTDLTELLKDATQAAYQTARGLFPVEHDAALPGPSLENLLRTIAKDTGIEVTFTKDFFCKKCTNPNMTPLYRIAQEALTNAVKHAQATHICLNLRCNAYRWVELSVVDNGIGRNAACPTLGGLGMSIMAHRANLIGAELRVEDGPHGGTIVTCRAPCNEKKTQQDTQGRV